MQKEKKFTKGLLPRGNLGKTGTDAAAAASVALRVKALRLLPGFGFPFQADVGGLELGVLSGLALCSICLLYTSDAADE